MTYALELKTEDDAVQTFESTDAFKFWVEQELGVWTRISELRGRDSERSGAFLTASNRSQAYARLWRSWFDKIPFSSDEHESVRQSRAQEVRDAIQDGIERFNVVTSRSRAGLWIAGLAEEGGSAACVGLTMLLKGFDQGIRDPSVAADTLRAIGVVISHSELVGPKATDALVDAARVAAEKTSHLIARQREMDELLVSVRASLETEERVRAEQLSGPPSFL